jgi:IrrE N-terminal-like domain
LGTALSAMTVELVAPRALPLNLSDVCKAVGVALRFEPASGKAPGGTYRFEGGSAEIVVRLRDPAAALLDARDRFTLAHELGHHCLRLLGAPAPRRRAEYWRHEELCNLFAASLLVPDYVVDELPEPSTAAQLGALIATVASEAGVSAETAARRIADHVTAPVAIGEIQLDSYPPTRRIGFRLWWVETKPWLGGDSARHQAIRVGHPLEATLRVVESLGIWGVGQPALDGARSAWVRRRSELTGSVAVLLASADSSASI